MLTVEFSGVLPASVSRSLVTRLARQAYRYGGGKKDTAVTVAVVGDAEMRKLNKRYRGKDKVTDILSFGYEEPSLGDLVICLPQVKRQAKMIGRPLRDEFALMVVHGVLHLLGYDHESLADERRMFRLQHEILSRAGIL